MPTSDKPHGPSAGVIVAFALLAAGLLVLFLGLSPRLSGDDRDIVLSGHLGSDSGGASSSSVVLESKDVHDKEGVPASSRADEHGSSSAASVPGDDATSSAPEGDDPADDEARADVVDYSLSDDVVSLLLLDDLLESPEDFNASIQEYPQYPEIPGGCEVASMVSVLRALGYDVNATSFINDFLLTRSGNHDMVNGYSGSPFESGAAFPPIMVRAGNAYLRAQESTWRFVERSGEDFAHLIDIVGTGRPVLIWTTMGMEPPARTESIVSGYEWYSNEHCVVVYGTSEAGNVLVMDPLDGMVERDRAAFEQVYNECGLHAVSLSSVVSDHVDTSEEHLELLLAATSVPAPEGSTPEESAPAPEQEAPAEESPA